MLFFSYKEDAIKWTDAGVMSNIGPEVRSVQVPLLCADSSRAVDYLIASSTIYRVEQRHLTLWLLCQVALGPPSIFSVVTLPEDVILSETGCESWNTLL
jgi:hypothetical protein